MYRKLVLVAILALSGWVNWLQSDMPWQTQPHATKDVMCLLLADPFIWSTGLSATMQIRQNNYFDICKLQISISHQLKWRFMEFQWVIWDIAFSVWQKMKLNPSHWLLCCFEVVFSQGHSKLSSSSSGGPANSSAFSANQSKISCCNKKLNTRFFPGLGLCYECCS